MSVMFVCLYMCGSLECNISLQIAHSQHSTLYNEARLQRTWKTTIAHSFRKRIATNVEDNDRIFWFYGAAATASFRRAHDSHVDVDYDSRATSQMSFHPEPRLAAAPCRGRRHHESFGLAIGQNLRTGPPVPHFSIPSPPLTSLRLCGTKSFNNCPFSL